MRIRCSQKYCVVTTDVPQPFAWRSHHFVARVVARLPYPPKAGISLRRQNIFHHYAIFEFIGSTENAQPQKTRSLMRALRNVARVSPSFRLFASLTARNIGKHVNACCRIVSKIGSRSPALPCFPRDVMRNALTVEPIHQLVYLFGIENPSFSTDYFEYVCCIGVENIIKS